jgi:D-amino-acid dehydrogenase
MASEPGSPNVVVVGAGLVGASTAYRLAGAGAAVTIVDRGDPGRATSAGAGIISPGIRFGPGDAILPLVSAAVAFYPELLAALAADGETGTGYEVVGALHLALDDAGAARLPALAAKLAGLRDGGLGHVGELTMTGPAEARALFPPLGPVAGALHIAGAARVDGRLLRSALLRASVAMGATLLAPAAATVEAGPGERARVLVGRDELPADAIVLAAGAWTGETAARLGVTVPVEPQRGQIAHLRLPGTATGAWPVIQGWQPHYLLTFPPDRVVAGATRETGSGFDHRRTVAGVAEVLDQVMRVAPGLGPATLGEVRIGFRPASADGLPLLGRAPGAANVWLATGHGPYGLTVGPWSGALVADCILGRDPGPDLAPFSPGRAVLSPAAG